MKRNKIRIGIAIIAAIITIALSSVLYNNNLNWPNNNESAYIIIISNTCLQILLMVINETVKGEK